MSGARVYLAVSAVAVGLKLLLFPAYRSTDFEVHRNWLAITHSLPLKEWYTEATSQWTLDYPPFFAWFEYGLSHVAKLFDPAMLVVSNLEYASPQTILFQRLSVVVTDIVFITAALALARHVSKQHGAWSGMGLFLLLVLNAGLLLVDHVHFQYNGIVIGLLLWSLYWLMTDQHWLAGVAYTCVVHMKHLYVYCGPVLLVYIARRWCGFSVVGAGRFLLMGLTVLAISALSLGPFIQAGQLQQLISRMFPFGRGLTHSYWAANAWALYSGADKVLASLMPQWRRPGHLDEEAGHHWVDTASGQVGVGRFHVLPPVGPRESLALVAVCLLPPVLALLRRPLPARVPAAIGYVLLTGFWFGYHVHEKAILPALLPLTVCAVRDKGAAQDWLVLAAAGHYGLLPLLHEAQEYPVKILLCLVYWLVAAHTLAAIHRPGRTGSDSQLPSELQAAAQEPGAYGVSLGSPAAVGSAGGGLQSYASGGVLQSLGSKGYSGPLSPQQSYGTQGVSSPTPAQPVYGITGGSMRHRSGSGTNTYAPTAWQTAGYGQEAGEQQTSGQDGYGSSSQPQQSWYTAAKPAGADTAASQGPWYQAQTQAGGNAWGGAGGQSAGDTTSTPVPAAGPVSPTQHAPAYPAAGAGSGAPPPSPPPPAFGQSNGSAPPPPLLGGAAAGAGQSGNLYATYSGGRYGRRSNPSGADGQTANSGAAMSTVPPTTSMWGSPKPGPVTNMAEPSPGSQAAGQLTAPLVQQPQQAGGPIAWGSMPAATGASVAPSGAAPPAQPSATAATPIVGAGGPPATTLPAPLVTSPPRPVSMQPGFMPPGGAPMAGMPPPGPRPLGPPPPGPQPMMPPPPPGRLPPTSNTPWQSPPGRGTPPYNSPPPPGPPQMPIPGQPPPPPPPFPPAPPPPPTSYDPTATVHHQYAPQPGYYGSYSDTAFTEAPQVQTQTDTQVRRTSSSGLYGAGGGGHYKEPWSLSGMVGAGSLLHPLLALYVLGFLPLELYCSGLHEVVMGERLPFLPLLLTSVYCSLGVGYVWVRMVLGYLGIGAKYV